jgi:prepilin-type processing-associated H-X9-DG protein
MKIRMNVEDVGLMVARPSQISLRLGALLDKNRRRRPVSRATKWLALLLTVAFIPLLAAARAASDSSPEKTVRSFVAALNAGHFEEAVRYVDGNSPHPDFTTLRQAFQLDKPNFSVSVLTTTTKDDKAVVKAALTIQSASQPAQTQTGNVAMVRHGTRWLIAPLLNAKNPYINPKTSDMSLLTSIAGVLQSPQVFETSREQARSESCKSNLKQIALAAFQLNFDQKILAITPQNFKAKLFPYLKSEQVFRCPSVSGGESYSFNGNLTNRKLESLPNAPRLVMFYEGRNGQLDFRHDGKANVAFADGHVQTISREEAKTLKWKP